MSPERRVRIREARRADFEELVALWGEVDDYHARLRPDFFRARRADGGGAPRRRSRQLLERLLRLTDGVLLVAEAQGLVGLVVVQIYETPAAEQLVCCRRAHVDELVVMRAHRRRGIGRMLMEAAAAWARRHGAVQVVLTVWAGNRIATRFYRRLGYAPVCQVLGLPLGGTPAGSPAMADEGRRR